MALTEPARVQVACIALSDDDACLAAAERVVGETEFQRFNGSVASRESLYAYAALRLVTASWLGTSSHELVLERTPHGRPFLAAGPGHGSHDINLSHAAGRCLIAMVRGGRVGIDIEGLTVRSGMDDIASWLFAESEQEMLAALPHDARARYFLRIYTAKESLTKALGLGISGPLPTLRFASEGNNTLELAAWPGVESASWVLLAPDVEPDIVASIAVRLDTAAEPTLDLQRHSLRELLSDVLPDV